MTEKATPLSDADLRAIGTLIEGRPERIAAIAAPLQQSGRVLESRVRGTSMGNTLPDGIAIRIELCSAQGYRRGEVVAFLVGSRLTVHRVVVARCWPRRSAVITRGDNRVFPDPPLRCDQILGRVVAVQSTHGPWAPVPAARPLAPARNLAAAVVTAALASLTSLIGTSLAHQISRFVYRLLGGPAAAVLAPAD